jgi:hypothetical protein
MRRHLTPGVVLACLLPLLGAMPPAAILGPFPIGGATNTITPDPTLSATTTSATTTMAVTTGAVMPSKGTAVVDMVWFGVQTLTGCSANDGGTFTQIGGSTAWYSGTGQQAWGLVTGATAGSTLTVTCTFSATIASTFPNMQIAEAHGSASGPVLDVSAAGASGTINTATTGNITTSIANEFIWGVVDMNTTVVPGTTPQTMTQLNPNGGSNAFIIQYGTAVTAGTNYATATISGGGSGQWAVTLAAMK